MTSPKIQTYYMSSGEWEGQEVDHLVATACLKSGNSVIVIKHFQNLGYCHFAGR
jgi:hypothetical protein